MATGDGNQVSEWPQGSSFAPYMLLQCAFIVTGVKYIMLNKGHGDLWTRKHKLNALKHQSVICYNHINYAYSNI